MKNLDELRDHIDRLDNALIYILAERMSLIPDVARYKAETGTPRYQPSREEEIISQKRELAKNTGLNPSFVENIYCLIIAHAHEIEKEIMEE